jgi:hypothetical protein
LFNIITLQNVYVHFLETAMYALMNQFDFGKNNLPTKQHNGNLFKWYISIDKLGKSICSLGLITRQVKEYYSIGMCACIELLSLF